MPISITESTFLFMISAILSSLVITNAVYQKQQFYPSVVYITKSNASMGIIYLQGLILVMLIGKLIVKLFFGQLRTAEIEHSIERSWYAVTETCLAFTVFRDDLSPKFVALFTLLLFLKFFHWLAEDRVDYMERSPNISIFFHIRVISLLSLLGLLDTIFVYMAYHSTLSKGASVQLVFGFEYAILFTIILNISMKYVLHFFDHYNENPWEDKAIYLLYTELIMGFLKITLYVIFVIIMMRIHTFPLFSIRPTYLAVRNFKKAINDVIMSRRAIQNMNTFYPNASEDDIENSDNVCIICRELMHGNGTCKKLPCNHIFHITCLRSWFQRQQTCPTCRMDVLRNNNNNNSQQQPQQPAAAAAPANNNQPPNNQQRTNQPQQPVNNGRIPTLPPMMPPLPPPPPPPPFTHPLFFQQFQQLFGQQQQQLQQQQRSNDQQPSAAPASSTASASNDNGDNATASAGATAEASTSSAIPPISSIPATIFPFLQAPPFQMPQIPVEVLLQSFSNDELKYLEGQSRQQLEGRIKCLMDAKTLITAAMIRLQQYNCVVLNCPQQQTSVGTQTTTFESADDDVAHDSIDKLSTPSSINDDNRSSPSMKAAQEQSSTTATPSTTTMINNSGDNSNNITNTSNNTTTTTTNDQEELIRQRRLQRFQQDNSDNTQH